MKRWPLRWQLASLTTAFVALVLGAVGFAASWHLNRQGVVDVDGEMRHIAREFYENYPRHQDIDWKSRVTVVRELLRPAPYAYTADIRNADGQVLFLSRTAPEAGLPALPVSQRKFITIEVAGQRMRFATFVGQGPELRLAMTLHTVEHTSVVLLRCFMIATPLVLLVVAAGGWSLAHRALAPIEKITSSAEQISARRLDQRLPLPQTGDEVERLTVVLNDVFDRLEASFLHATRFTADASHELKTPLTVIRGELEEAIRSGDFAPEQQRLLVNLLEETERLTQITDGLLLLSRADTGRLTLNLKPFDLVPLLRDLLEDAEVLGASSEIEVEGRLPLEAWVQAAPQFLKQLLLNLIDNAIKYNEHQGRMTVALYEDKSTWSICISNTGPGVSPQDAEHVFDRFYRGDSMLSRSRKGHGLGLSICREIARAHGGEIAMAIDEPGWTKFRVSLPKAAIAEIAGQTAAVHAAGDLALASRT